MATKTTKTSFDTSGVKAFPSLNAYHDYLAKAKVNKYFDGRERSQETSQSRQKFTGTKSFESADSLMVYGDTKETLTLMQEIKKQTINVRTKPMPQREYYIYGGAVCVPRAIIGHPYAMYRFGKNPQADPTLDVIYCASIAWYYSTDQIRIAAAKMYVAIDALEKMGYRINLFVTNIGADKYLDEYTKSCKLVGSIVRVKDAGMGISPIRCAYPLINPSMMRRHFFRYVETCPGETSAFTGSYGMCITDPNMMRKALEASKYKADVYIAANKVIDKKPSVSQLIEQIKEQIKTSVGKV